MLGERRHVREQLVLRDLLGRAGVDVFDDDTRNERDPRRKRRRVATCVDRDEAPEIGERTGE
jgi:hypothetical protein